MAYTEAFVVAVGLASRNHQRHCTYSGLVSCRDAGTAYLRVCH